MNEVGGSDRKLACCSLLSTALQVGVHIADVSHFIRHGSALDREAAARGTTVYLCDKVYSVPYSLHYSFRNILAYRL